MNPEMYKITNTNRSLEQILHDKVKATATIDDIRLKSISKINQTDFH